MSDDRRTRTYLVSAAATALSLAFVLGGCGGNGGSSGSSDPAKSSSSKAIPKACVLLTAPIAATVTGSPSVKKREATPNPHMTQCQYGGPNSFANLEAGDCAFMKQFDAPADGKPVTGVGDTALSSPSGLFTCKGNLALDLDVSIAGSFTGGAADKVEATQLKWEKKLANEIFSANH